MLGLAQIQSDEHVHLDLLGQTLDGHDLDLLRIGTSHAIFRCMSSVDARHHAALMQALDTWRSDALGYRGGAFDAC